MCAPAKLEDEDPPSLKILYENTSRPLNPPRHFVKMLHKLRRAGGDEDDRLASFEDEDENDPPFPVILRTPNIS